MVYNILLSDGCRLKFELSELNQLVTNFSQPVFSCIVTDIIPDDATNSKNGHFYAHKHSADLIFGMVKLGYAHIYRPNMHEFYIKQELVDYLKIALQISEINLLKALQDMDAPYIYRLNTAPKLFK